MLDLARILGVAVAVVAPAMGIGACGGGGDVVARVGGVPITRAAVSHWMGTFAGEDYYELSRKHTVPDGLVSDPPDYRRCVAKLEAAAGRSPNTKGNLTGSQLFGKCQQLYQALRTQAAAFLVKAQWMISSYRDLGISVSEREVEQFLNRFKTRTLPREEGGFQQYLTRRRLSVSDVMLNLKLDLLEQKAIQKFGPSGGQSQPVLARFNEAGEQWTLKTTCEPGYVVDHCKQYKGGATYPSSPPPSVLMEQVAALVTGRCVNVPACGKQ